MKLFSLGANPGRKYLFTTVIAVATILILLFSFTLINGSQKASASSFKLIWSDEFNGGAGPLNTSNWQYDLGHQYTPSTPWDWGTGEVEAETNSTANVALDGNGHLKITPLKDGAGNWTSARIETTRTDFAAPAGGIMAIEASLQMPNVTGASADGYWPAFWALGAPFRGNYWNWPGVGEIDIMENVSGINNNWGTFHCGVWTSTDRGPCHESDGISSSRGGLHPCTPTTCQQAFHTYRIEYDRSTSPEEIRWYLDGVNYHTVKATEVPQATWDNATKHGFFIILNVAMGGQMPVNNGRPLTNATQPGHPMVVDYVRVYYANGGGPIPTKTPVVAPTKTPTGSTTIKDEAESLTSTTNGPPNTISNDVNCSGGVCMVFKATAVGNVVTYNVAVPAAGTYDVRIGVKKFSNKGIFQFASNGVNHGPPQDLYAVAATFTEVDLGNVQFNSAATKSFSFTVTGKNSNSSGYTLGIDYIKLIH